MKQEEREFHLSALKIEFSEIQPVLNEQSLRIWCAAKARAFDRVHGRGGVSLVSEATGISRPCIYRGAAEIEQGIGLDIGQIRHSGGGRKKNH